MKIKYHEALSYTQDLPTPQKLFADFTILREGFLPIKLGGGRVFIVDKTVGVVHNGTKVGTALVWTIR
jgi:hypothetical protein